MCSSDTSDFLHIHDAILFISYQSIIGNAKPTMYFLPTKGILRVYKRQVFLRHNLRHTKTFFTKNTHAGSIANTTLPAILIAKLIYLTARKAKISIKNTARKVISPNLMDNLLISN